MASDTISKRTVSSANPSPPGWAALATSSCSSVICPSNSLGPQPRICLTEHRLQQATLPLDFEIEEIIMNHKLLHLCPGYAALTAACGTDGVVDGNDRSLA